MLLTNSKTIDTGTSTTVANTPKLNHFCTKFERNVLNLCSIALNDVVNHVILKNLTLIPVF